MLRLSNEEKMLLAFCSSNTISQKEITQLEKEIDWNKLFSIAEYQQVSSFFYYNARRSIDFPQSIENKFRSILFSNALRNKLLVGESKKIAVKLQENKIENVFLKGLPLISRVYKNISVRFIQDIDLLVPKKSVNKAISVLKMLDYSISENEHPRCYWEKYGHHYPFSKKYNMFYQTDLHWSIFLKGTPFNYSSEEVFQRLVKSKGFYFPSNEDLLFQQCAALSHHGFFYKPLRYLVDIAQIVDTLEINWRFFVLLSKKSKATAFIYYPLLLSKNLLGVNIPDWVIKDLREDANKKHMFLIKNLLLQKNLFKEEESKYSLGKFVLELAYTTSNKDKVLLIKRGISTLME